MPSIYNSPYRHYRNRCTPRSGEYTFQAMVEETDVRVTVPENFELDLALKITLETIRKTRGDIFYWCGIQPKFRHCLEPLVVPDEAPEVVQHMARGATPMGVGPFASVAGAVAQHLALRLAAEQKIRGLPINVLVENGGDNYLISQRSRVVALLPVPNKKEQVGLVINDFPVSLCASSSSIGHSLSFGNGDLAVARAKDGALADAAATAYCNMLQSEDDVALVLERAKKDAAHGIEGVFVQCAGKIGVWGAMELTGLG